jgi:hypothetical protein
MTNRRIHIRELEHIRSQIDDRQREVARPDPPLPIHSGIQHCKLQMRVLARTERMGMFQSNSERLVRV